MEIKTRYASPVRSNEFLLKMCRLSSRERRENKRGLPVNLWGSMDKDVGKSKNRMRSGIIGIAKITTKPPQTEI